MCSAAGKNESGLTTQGGRLASTSANRSQTWLYGCDDGVDGVEWSEAASPEQAASVSLPIDGYWQRVPFPFSVRLSGNPALTGDNDGLFAFAAVSYDQEYDK